MGSRFGLATVACSFRSHREMRRRDGHGYTHAHPRSSHMRRVHKAALRMLVPFRLVHKQGTRRVHRRHAAQAPQPVSPHPRTCAPRYPIRRAPYAHARPRSVRTRGVCTKPWRVESEITRATTWHRVALTFYQPQDRDAYSMLEVESARRRCRCAHLRLHGSTPPKLMRAWSGAACTASSCNTLLLGTADEHRTHGASA